MQYDLLVFETETHDQFRTLSIDGEPWFVLADVCRSLGLQSKAGYFGHHAERLDDDEKQLVSSSVIDKANPPALGEGRRGNPSLTIISESGLYALIVTSRLPNAKRFRKWVTSEVLPSIRRTGAYRVGGGRTPAFIRRFNDNWDRVSPGHFSVIAELVVRLHGRLEMVGHLMADYAPDGKELRPDVSVGGLFAKWLRDNHAAIATNFSYYWHKLPNGLEVEARQYPMALLPLYIEFVDNIWIPEHSQRYFQPRDPKALPYLPRLLPMAHKAKPALPRSAGTPARTRFLPKPVRAS